jgi:hypothetical protein
MTNVIEMYADESYGGDNSTGPLTLAMYLYEREQATLARAEWLAVLNDSELPRPLPFFRMTDCAHATGPFHGMADHCDRIARKIIPIPKARSIVGFSGTVDQENYAQIMPRSQGFPNAYTFLAQSLVTFIDRWIVNNNFGGKVIYYFEASHKHQADADRIMNEIKDGQHIRRSSYYSRHAFGGKTEMPLLQSADLLAWHSFTDFKRRGLGREMRKDYVALLRPTDKCQRWTAEELRVAAPLVKFYDAMGNTKVDFTEALRKADHFTRKG